VSAKCSLNASSSDAIMPHGDLTEPQDRKLTLCPIVMIYGDIKKALNATGG
jgi:hypothetical protein